MLRKGIGVWKIVRILGLLGLAEHEDRAEISNCLDRLGVEVYCWNLCGYKMVFIQY